VSAPRAEPVDYAKLNAVHTALLAAIALSTARRGRGERVSTAEWAQLAMATFSISKAVTREKIGSWVREPFVENLPDGDRQPRGDRLRAAVGELVTCSRCLGAWSALSLIGVRHLSPEAGRVTTAVFATAGANDFLQAAFRLLASRTNVVQHEAEQVERQ
jgi:hypothetical protein